MTPVPELPAPVRSPTFVTLLVIVLMAGCRPADRAMRADTAAADSVAADTLPERLTGTTWRLVRFQSMSDEIGTLHPEDPSRFLMQLGRDGTVALRLDCNRATGSWSAKAAPDGDGTGDAVSGSFVFGPLAATRALCPPPRLDQRIVRDAEWVRSYLLRGDRLHLSLMADGGIYTWAAIPSDAF